MSTVETGSAPVAPAAPHAGNGPLHQAPLTEPPRNRRGLTLGRFVFLILLVVAAAGGVYSYRVGTERAREEALRLVSYARQYMPSPAGPVAESKLPEPAPSVPWDGFVRVKEEDAKAIGLLLHTVEP